MYNSLEEHFLQKFGSSITRKDDIGGKNNQDFRISQKKKGIDKPVEEMTKALGIIKNYSKLDIPGSFQTVFTGHDSMVCTVSFSPDGEYIASGSKDKLIKIWNVKEKIEEFSLSGHTEAIRSLVYSQDGTFLISGSEDKTIKSWSIDHQKLNFTLNGHESAVLSVSLNVKSTFLASGSKDLKVKLWDLEQKSETWAFSGHTDWVYSVNFSPNMEFLASGSEDKTIKIWNLHTKTEEFSLLGHGDEVWSVCFSPDNLYLASGSEDNTVKLWHIGTHNEIFTYTGHQSDVYCVNFSPNGKYIASASRDKTVIVWDVDERKEIYTLAGHDDWVHSVSFSPNSQKLASASSDSSIIIWNIEDKKDKKDVCTLVGHEHTIIGIRFSLDGKFVYCAARNRCIKAWDLARKKEEFCLTGHFAFINCFDQSPDGKYFATGSIDKQVKIWNVAERREEFYFVGHPDSVWTVHFSPNSDYLASGCRAMKIIVWNLYRRTKEFMLSGHGDLVSSVRFSPDGRYLASGSFDNSIKIWNLDLKDEVCTFTGHSSDVNCLAYTPNGRFLASGSRDKTVKIWNLAEKKEVFSLVGHSDWVYSICISSDMRFLASGSKDKTIKIWNLLEKREECTLIGHEDTVFGLAFSSNGKILASGARDKLVKLWNVPEIPIEKRIEVDSKIGMMIENINLNSPKNSYPTEIFTTTLDPISLSNYDFQNWSCFHSTLRYLEGGLYEKITSPNIVLTNLNFSILHFLALIGQTDQIAYLTKTKHATLMQDAFGHSPLYYSIKTKHQGITDLLLDYLCKIVNSQIKDISSYISLESINNDLGLIISNSSEILDSFFGDVLLKTIKEPFFGTPKESLPICYLSELCISYPDDFAQDGEEKIPLAFKASPFVIPSTLGSMSSLKIIKAILTSKNENIFRTEFIQLFIIQRWKAVIFWVYLYTSLIWVNIVLLVLLIDNPSEYYSIPLFIVNLILSGSEITQLFIIGKEYFASKMNILDIFRMVFTISFIISLRVFDVKSNDIVWVTMVLNLLKGISGFRAFSNTRYYIRLLYESIYGMKDFLIVFVYTIISLGLLNAISGEQKVLTFKSIWMNSFGLVVGDTDNFYNESLVQHITFIIAITLNLIIMLNMVISLLGDSFDEFQLNAEIYNYKEMLEVIFEIEQVRSLYATCDQFSYFHVCMHSYEQTGSGWKGKVIDTRSFIKEKIFEEDIKPLVENNILSVNKKIVGVETSVRSIDSTIKANAKNTDDTISMLKTKISTLEDNIKEVNEKVIGIDSKLETLLSLLSPKI